MIRENQDRFVFWTLKHPPFRETNHGYFRQFGHVIDGDRGAVTIDTLIHADEDVEMRVNDEVLL